VTDTVPRMAKRSRQLKRRADGWVNVLTGIGDSSRDKRFGASARNVTIPFIDDDSAEALWRADDQAARVVEIPPSMMLRTGFTTTIAQLEPRDTSTPAYVEQLDSEDSDERQEVEKRTTAIVDELEVASKFITALQWERAYGGAAILLGADDGQGDPSKPLRLESLRAIRSLVVLRRRELWPKTWNGNQLSPGFGNPVTWEVQRETSASVPTRPFVVHTSRLIIFPGIVTSRRMTGEARGWGDSIFVRLVSVLRDFQQAHATVPILLQDFAQAVHKIKGLAELLANGDDDLVRSRLEAVELGRSVMRAAAIDAEDDLSRTVTPVAGLPEMLDTQSKRWAAAAGIPPSLLFGEAPAGLNSTGEVNERWFADELEGARTLRVRPRLNRLMRLILSSTEGPTAGLEPASWSISFGPLSMPRPPEVAELRLKTAQADQIYVGAQVLTPEEVAQSRFGTGEWSADTHLDHDTRAAMRDAGGMPGIDPGDPALQKPDPNADPEADPEADPNADPADPADDTTED